MTHYNIARPSSVDVALYHIRAHVENHEQLLSELCRKLEARLSESRAEDGLSKGEFEEFIRISSDAYLKKAVEPHPYASLERALEFFLSALVSRPNQPSVQLDVSLMSGRQVKVTYRLQHY